MGKLLSLPYATVGSAVNELDTTYWNQGSIFGRVSWHSEEPIAGQVTLPPGPCHAARIAGMCIRAGLHSGISAVGLNFT